MKSSRSWQIFAPQGHICKRQMFGSFTLFV
uniref:Uncharacterized protein n=1 Tax=Lepeophtheirus salmonis TaxID=72036 RepID=A0A0K2SYG8_LEPSM